MPRYASALPDLHDVSPVAREHALQCRERAVDVAQVAHFRDALELGRCHVLDEGEHAGHGDVHPYVDGPQFTFDALCRRFHGIGVRHVALEDDGLATQGFHIALRTFQAFEAACQQPDVRALRLGEHLRRGASDAGRSSGDDDDAGFRRSAHELTLFGCAVVRPRASLSCITARTYSTCENNSGVLPRKVSCLASISSANSPVSPDTASHRRRMASASSQRPALAKRVRVPEDTRQERALELADGKLLAAHRVGRIEAVDEPVDHQFAFDGRQRADDARMTDRQKLHQRNEQGRRIERVRAVALTKRILERAPAFLHHLRMNGGGRLAPVIGFSGVAGAFGDVNGAFEHDPAHHPAGDVVRLLRQFPHTAVFFLPMRAGEIRRAAKQPPELLLPFSAVIEVDARAVREEPQRAELHLFGGTVAAMHRQTVLVPANPFDFFLVDVRIAVQPVAHLQRRLRGGGQAAEPVQISLHFR